MKKLLLIAALAASFTASAKDYTFEKRMFIESCIGVGTLISSKIENADAMRSAYLKTLDEQETEIAIFNAGMSKGMVLGRAMSSNRATLSLAIDSWESYHCDLLYLELVQQ